ncbi:MAG TPA: PilZ domain-containing protein [Magnetospirillaceae bacterium]|nr:PilZ domain-containing protein [Magnetospirillaceae bacterium]
MAVPVKRVEREFLFRAACDEGRDVLLSAGGGEWSVRFAEIQDKFLVFSHSVPSPILSKGALLDFSFLVRGQSVAFRARVKEVGKSQIVTEMPDNAWKNLSRRYPRMVPPAGLGVSFSFKGERYALSFPSSEAYDPVEEPQSNPDFDPRDIRQLMQEFYRQASRVASDRAVVMYKSRGPEGIEEELLTRHGRIYYLPTAIGGIPAVDPFSSRRILTRNDFLGLFEERGVDSGFREDELARVERAKRVEGILSEVKIPILFQEYVTGFVHLLNQHPGKAPFDLGVLDTFAQFAKVLAWSLKINGYFRNAPRKGSGMPAETIDLSAGGILFGSPDESLLRAMLEGSEIVVTLSTGKRSLTAGGVVRRRFLDERMAFYGVVFTSIAPEDFRYLFEYLYGRPFTDEDATSIEGLPMRGMM